MSQTAKQSPLGVNLLGSMLQNIGLSINPTVTNYLGTSRTNSNYNFGTIVNNTCLRLLTYSINDAYARGEVDNTTYNNLIDIKGVGNQTIRALGNSKSDQYVIFDPKSSQDPNGAWKGQANTGYAIEGDTNNAQSATWIPYNKTNINHGITQWGFFRCFALQAYNEFNYNGNPNTIETGTPEYKEFTSSFLSCNSFLKDTNSAIFAMQNSKTFLQGAYSNQDDLITADISGISLAFVSFGRDLINLGKTIDLSAIGTFGLPSNLLNTLRKNNAITQSLSLALLSAGITSNDLDTLALGGILSTNKEKQIYGAFGIIGGVDLEEILICLNCKTENLIVLSDLLNLRKLFPTSVNTLTVPVYNITESINNSKTYYPIYVNNSINSQVFSRKFGNYLIGILPDDQAQAAGAFSVSMQQVRNIQFVDFEKFAQVVFSLETTANLPNTNGTNVPTDTVLASQGVNLTGAGSGVYGTYTMSDFFGCMTGLPYPWISIFNNIKNIETQNLYNIYRNLYLAVQWEQATATVQYTSYVDGLGITYYSVTGVTINNKGGGYLREGAAIPTITISNGAIATLTLGIDENNVGSNGEGQYGRVLQATLTSSGPDTTVLPTASITPPPGPGWPAMNIVVQSYIDLANNEISSIFVNGNQSIIKELNAQYDLIGSLLTVEQRARFIALPPVPIISPPVAPVPYSSSGSTKDYNLNPYPGSIITFVDSLSELSTETNPHMSSQVLESISDYCNVGGQSLIALLRQERNKYRLNIIGVEQDNNISNELEENQKQLLMANGTIPNAVTGIPTLVVGQNNEIVKYTPPAWPGNNQCNGTPIRVKPAVSVNPNLPAKFDQAGAPTVNDTAQKYCAGSILPILETNYLGPNNDGTGPSDGTTIPVIQINTLVPCSFSNEVIDITKPVVPGAVNQTVPIIPLNLDTLYTSSTLYPSTYNIQEAIDKVIECNCDCWVD